MQKEAEDLKLESFGVEVGILLLFSYKINYNVRSTQLLHTIGNIYIMKATSFMKSRKFLGMCVPIFYTVQGEMCPEISCFLHLIDESTFVVTDPASFPA